MSAVNVVCSSRRACVLTDASMYDHTGTTIAFGLKAYSVESWTGVITGRGNMSGREIAGEIAETFASFDEFVARSAPMIERAHRAVEEDLRARDFPGQRFIEVHAVGWSERRDRPEAYVLCSPSPLMADGRAPYVWDGREEEDGVFHCLHPSVENWWQLHRQGAEEGVDWTVETFDPIRHGIPLMEMQRREPADTKFGSIAGRYVIGGALWLSVVDRDGMRQGVIREWPDVVGEPIRPAPLDVDSLPKIAPSWLPAGWSFERFDRAYRAGIFKPGTLDFDMAELNRFEAAAPAGAGIPRHQRRAAKAMARKLARA